MWCPCDNSKMRRNGAFSNLCFRRRFGGEICCVPISTDNDFQIRALMSHSEATRVDYLTGRAGWELPKNSEELLGAARAHGVSDKHLACARDLDGTSGKYHAVTKFRH